MYINYLYEIPEKIKITNVTIGTLKSMLNLGKQMCVVSGTQMTLVFTADHRLFLAHLASVIIVIVVVVCHCHC